MFMMVEISQDCRIVLSQDYNDSLLDGSKHAMFTGVTRITSQIRPRLE